MVTSGDILLIRPPSGTECSICLEQFRPFHDIVSMKLCKHFYHRNCITKWLVESCNNTCPTCRAEICLPDPASDLRLAINAISKLLPTLTGTHLEGIGQEFERRLEVEDRVTEEMVDWLMEQAHKLAPKLANKMEQLIQFQKDDRSLQHAVKPTRDHTSRTRIVLNQYEVDIDTDTDLRFVSIAVRNDLESLSILLIQAISFGIDDTRAFGDRCVWIELVSWILDQWHWCGYPRTNYITLPSLERLVVCAALIYKLGQDTRYNNTLEFAQLVAHGDRLLLEAQRKARSMNQPSIQYRRVLDHPDNWSRQLTEVDDYANNTINIEWIVSLRNRVRGPGADPFGPAPTQP